MTTKRKDPKLDERLKPALEELKSLIRQHYPEATFSVTCHPEDPEVVLLRPIVDVEDRDEVVDVVLDRLLQMQDDEDLPIMVVPRRTGARNAALVTAMREAALPWTKAWLTDD
jgi:hypothetical protein